MARYKVHQINLTNRYGHGVTLCGYVSKEHDKAGFTRNPVHAVAPGSVKTVTCCLCRSHKLYQAGE